MRRINQAAEKGWIAFLERVAPPLDVKLNEWQKPTWFIVSAVVGALFITNSIACLIRGTFMPDDDPKTKLFLEYFPDIVNYLFICPLYVVLGYHFVIRSARLEQDLQAVWEMLPASKPSSRTTALGRFVPMLAVAMLISGAIIYFYAQGYLRYEILLWPLSVAANGHPFYGVHGVYYLFSNWLLNLTMILCGFYHFSMFKCSRRFAQGAELLVKRPEDVPEIFKDADHLRRVFRPFSTVNALSKALIATYMLNAITWSWEDHRPNAEFAFIATVLALFILGVGIFPYPRYHIQYWIYQVWKRKEKFDYIDVRTPGARGVSAVSDSIILGATAISLLLDTLLRLFNAPNLKAIFAQLLEFLKGMGMD